MRGLAHGRVVDVAAESGGEDEGFVCTQLRLPSKRCANLFNGRIGRIDGQVTEGILGAAQADRGVLEVEVDHVQVGFETFGKRLRHAANEQLVFTEAHRRDIGKLVILMDEGGVRVRGMATACEDVEQGDGVAGEKPVVDGDGDGEGGGVAVRGENEDLQVRAPSGAGKW